MPRGWFSGQSNDHIEFSTECKSKESEMANILNFIQFIGTGGANIYNSLFPSDGTEKSLLGTTTAGSKSTKTR